MANPQSSSPTRRNQSRRTPSSPSPRTFIEINDNEQEEDGFVLLGVTKSEVLVLVLNILLQN